MTRLLSAFGKAVSFTAKGAAVTFGSTVFSCAAACSIEKSANRMILKYYPHKFANVEAASGITQEELDFVHFMYGGRIVAASADPQETDTSPSSLTTTTRNAEVLFRYDSFDDSNVVHTSRYDEPKSETRTTARTEIKYKRKEQEDGRSTVDKFWTEGEEAASKALSLLPIIVPRQEILACSMTA